MARYVWLPAPSELDRLPGVCAVCPVTLMFCYLSQVWAGLSCVQAPQPLASSVFPLGGEALCVHTAVPDGFHCFSWWGPILCVQPSGVHSSVTAGSAGAMCYGAFLFLMESAPEGAAGDALQWPMSDRTPG